MNDEERLHQQMVQIGARYITRTLGELPRIGELLAQAQAGSPAALKELERAAHKVHGSGAMFGFQEVSDTAGDIEHLAGYLADGSGPEHLRELSEPELRSRLAVAVTQLDQATRKAAQNIGIAAHGG